MLCSATIKIFRTAGDSELLAAFGTDLGESAVARGVASLKTFLEVSHAYRDAAGTYTERETLPLLEELDKKWSMDPLTGLEKDAGYRDKIDMLSSYLHGIANELHESKHGKDKESVDAKANWGRLLDDIKTLKTKLADHKIGEIERIRRPTAHCSCLSPRVWQHLSRNACTALSWAPFPVRVCVSGLS